MKIFVYRKQKRLHSGSFWIFCIRIKWGILWPSWFSSLYFPLLPKFREYIDEEIPQYKEYGMFYPDMTEPRSWRLDKLEWSTSSDRAKEFLLAYFLGARRKKKKMGEECYEEII